jgi:hypothetical protein
MSAPSYVASYFRFSATISRRREVRASASYSRNFSHPENWEERL